MGRERASSTTLPSFQCARALPRRCRSGGIESHDKLCEARERDRNKVFLITMNDGKEVIAKLPNPNAGRAHFTTASEVATMDFVRHYTAAPMPVYYLWHHSKASTVS